MRLSRLVATSSPTVTSNTPKIVFPDPPGIHQAVTPALHRLAREEADK
jgi:hypothetical protein